MLTLKSLVYHPLLMEGAVFSMLCVVSIWINFRPFSNKHPWCDMEWVVTPTIDKWKKMLFYSIAVQGFAFVITTGSAAHQSSFTLKGSSVLFPSVQTAFRNTIILSSTLDPPPCSIKIVEDTNLFSYGVRVTGVVGAKSLRRGHNQRCHDLLLPVCGWSLHLKGTL